MPTREKALSRRGLSVAVAVAALAASATAAQAGPNILTDGDFESATPIALNSTFSVANPATHNIWGDRQGWSKQSGGPGLSTQYARQFTNGSTDELFQGVPLAGSCAVPGATLQVSFDYKTLANTVSTQTRYRVLAFGPLGLKPFAAPWTPTDATSLLPGTATVNATVNAGNSTAWATHTSQPFMVPDPAPAAIGLGIQQGFQGGQTAVDGQGVDNVKMSVTSFPATVDVDPNTLSLSSRGRWVTAYITLPDCFDVEDVDTSTVELVSIDNDVVYPLPIAKDRSDIQDGTLMVKFDRQALITALGDEFGDRTLQVEGELTDGTSFSAEDTIRVIR